MKMKNIVAMTMAATMVWNGTAVFGATGVKTAVLNDARISFNGRYATNHSVLYD